MSFVDLVTLTSHRRHELETRIHDFDTKCDRAINDLKNMKLKARGFINHLNCDPTELKERFLGVMQKLDEYMYLVTDFNLALAQTAEPSDADSPVQDLSIQTVPASLSPFNIMDVLTEPRPTTSHVCPNLCPQPEPVRVPAKGEPRLIVFSGSSSAESVPGKSEKEVQCKMVEPVARLTIKESNETAAVSLPPSPDTNNHIKDCCISSAQTLLEVDHEYPATIMNIEGGNLTVITDDPIEVTSFMSEMTTYYENKQTTLSLAEIAQMTYCAYSDDGFYYRGMLLNKPKDDEKTVSVYVVDTGEIRPARLDSLRPLHKQFCSRPPYARFCHLAGIDLSEGLRNESLLQKQEAFLKKFCNMQCTILIDDNSSETLGIFVMLPSGKTLNQILVENNLAVPLDTQLSKQTTGFLQRENKAQTPARREPLSKPLPVNMGPTYGPPPSEDEWSDIMQCPEYEDPVVAVTGYHNRDEADICKHYKGPPEKTCFKGTRCTKKHILHHPDGWTLDQVPILAKCESIPLPAPGTCVKVLVTAVCHFDRVFVQLVTEKEEEEIPEFGFVLPPKTLDSLRRDMNSPATIQAYKRLTISPAPGELVAAMYTDKWWYRARVRTVTRADQCVEVIFIDYGTVLWVKEDQVRALEPRFLSLPIQAIQCVLAGVLQSTDSTLWARAKRALADMVLDREILAHVIAREFDEIIVELITYEEGEEAMRGACVAERLADLGLVALGEYSVAYDTGVTQKQVVP